MKIFLKRYFYRIALIASIVAPAAVMLSDTIPNQSWRFFANQLYPRLLFFQEAEEADASRVAVIRIDNDTIKELGWPIDRIHYIQLLEKLKASGHPWLLSQLWFQEDAGSRVDPLVRKQLDRDLGIAIESYGRFIGTGMKYDPEEEPTGFQEKHLLPKVIISNDGIDYGSLNILPFTLPFVFTEADQFVQKQKAFGFAPTFGRSPVHCAQMALQADSVIIPSAVVWAAAYANGQSLQFSDGNQWANKDGAKGTPMQVSTFHCLSAPKYSTTDWVNKRQLKDYSMARVLSGAEAIDFNNKIVILASDDAKSVRGPGIVNLTEKYNGTVKDWLLTARFLDDMVENRSVMQSESSIYGNDKSIAIAIVVVAVAGAFLLPLDYLIILLTGFLVSVFAVSISALVNQQHFIPVRSIALSTAYLINFIALSVGLRYTSFRRHVSLSDAARNRLYSCQTIEALAIATQRCLKTEFPNPIVTPEYDKTLYDAVENPENAFKYLADQAQNEGNPSFSGLEVIIDTDRRPIWSKIFGRQIGTWEAREEFKIHSHDTCLGSFAISFNFRETDRILAGKFLKFLQTEISSHWSRIHMQAEQKIADYKIFSEQTRSSMLSRFLSHVVVSRFSDGKSMEENLNTILTPRAGRAALLQADIRGYSKVAEKMDPMEMVKILQSYFKPVVDKAQYFSQIKLIGDCIFLFIERGFGSANHSPADLTLYVASTLVRETLAQNKRLSGAHELNFGIAIHYGDVIVGNLSSDTCIDYTVIGPNVNLVARMEEMTKHPEIQKQVGHNGIILSQDAAAALQYYKHSVPKPIDLKAKGVAVRSFEHIHHVNYFTAAEALQLKELEYEDTIAEVPKLAS